MNNLTKAIFEHLKTKKKYNTLMLKYETLQDQFQEKTTELGVERQIHKKRSEVWEKSLYEQEQQIIKLKKENKELKRKKKKSEKNENKEG